MDRKESPVKRVFSITSPVTWAMNPWAWALFRLGDSFKPLRAANKPAQAMSTMVYSFLNMETTSLRGQGKDGEGEEEERAFPDRKTGGCM